MRNYEKLWNATKTYAQSSSQWVRLQIQQHRGTSGDINTSDLNRGLRAEQTQGDDFEKDASKFIYTSPLDFYRNHRKNMDEFIEKHISKPIDELGKSISGDK